MNFSHLFPILLWPTFSLTAVVLFKRQLLWYSLFLPFVWFLLGTDFLLAPMRRYSWVPSLPPFKSPETWLSQKPRCWGPLAAYSQAQQWLETRGHSHPHFRKIVPGMGGQTCTQSTVFVAGWSRDVQSSFKVQLSHCTAHLCFIRGGGEVKPF